LHILAGSPHVKEFENQVTARIEKIVASKRTENSNFAVIFSGSAVPGNSLGKISDFVRR
jgi:5'-3' exonuclease